jgi:hypothetical protein
MFKNRSVEVKLVKDPKPEDTNAPIQEPTDYVRIARESMAAVGGTAVAVFGSYMAFDTLRQIAIHAAQVKIK